MNDATLPMRTGTPEDWDAVARLVFTAYHNPSVDQAREQFRPIYEPDRALLVTDGDTVVGHISAQTRTLTVPGAVVPAAHLTLAAVAPTHRRRGLLSRMMHRLLHDVRQAGAEPVTVQWPSEGRIYARYGSALASQRLTLEIDTREARLPDGPPGGLRTGDPVDLLPYLAKVYDEVRGDRPGYSGRGTADWAHVLDDEPANRGGGTERRAVLCEGPGGVNGYALWRTRFDWSALGADCAVQVGEVLATDRDAYLALWRFLLSIDLTRAVHYEFGALDEPLLHLVNEPNRLGARLLDGLWIRVVDVPAALSARRYATPVDVVLEVRDELLAANTGRWRLTGGPDGARCVRVTGSPDLAMGVYALGSAYLGGPSLFALARAGLVREYRPGALAAASAAFGWRCAPAAIEYF